MRHTYEQYFSSFKRLAPFVTFCAGHGDAATFIVSGEYLGCCKMVVFLSVGLIQDNVTDAKYKSHDLAFFSA